jgi:exosortase
METPLQASGAAKHSMLEWALIVLPFAWLWYLLVDNLRLQWATDAQYSYGLVVPLLAIGLAFRRWQRYSKVPWHAGELKNPPLLVLCIASLIFLYLPTQLVEEAVPEWRPIEWLFAIETIGLTLYAIYLFKGRNGLVRLAFPICFFFTAVPWPTFFEQPIIQHLSRANAGMVVNVLSFLDIPAIQHGNVIEISTGVVGINDACSGIRSLQSSLMISLFLSEFYFMRWPRRILLVLGSFLLAMFFNVCRTSFLTYIAAKKGIDAISQYHDEAGITILFACTATLWAVSYLSNLLPKASAALPQAADTSVGIEYSPARYRILRNFAVGLIVWIILVDVSVGLWYAIREAGIKPGAKWSVVLPKDNATLKILPFTPDEHILLQFDDGIQGEWVDGDGTIWRAFYFDWLPGRVAGYLAKRHTPDICLSAMGLKMTSGPSVMNVTVDNIVLPMRYYVFDSDEGPMQVFQGHWEPGIDKEYTDESSRFSLVRGVWTTRGNKGQKVIEIVITGCNDPALAKQKLVQELQKMIKVENPGT